MKSENINTSNQEDKNPTEVDEGLRILARMIARDIIAKRTACPEKDGSKPNGKNAMG